MPTATAQRLVSEFGGPEDYRFSAAVQLKPCTKLSTTFERVDKYEPWGNSSAKELLKHHPLAIWKSLHVKLSPRAGIYGRMCTFYGGWAAAGMDPPTTVADMIQLHNAIDFTYGGTGDPGTTIASISCDFDNTMKDLLKAPSSENDSRPVFYYCFTETDILDKAKDADRFMLTFQGTFTLHGRY